MDYILARNPNGIRDPDTSWTPPVRDPNKRYIGWQDFQSAHEEYAHRYARSGTCGRTNSREYAKTQRVLWVVMGVFSPVLLFAAYNMVALALAGKW